MSKKTEPCEGLEIVAGNPVLDITGMIAHCRGCTSATERIAALEQELKDWKQLFVDVQKSRRMDCVSHGELRAELGVKITAMRTLAGELAEAARRYREPIEVEDIWNRDQVIGRLDETERLVEAALAKAEKMGVGDVK